MSSVDSQSVDGVWGQSMPDTPPPAPEYNPAAEPDAQPLPNGFGQTPDRSSVWDVEPTEPDYVQVAQPDQAQPQPETPSGTEAVSAEPQPADAELRRQIEELRSAQSARDQKDAQGREQWNRMVADQKQKDARESRQASRNEVISQSRYLDDDARERYLQNAFSQIENQYESEIQQMQQQSEQQIRYVAEQAYGETYKDRVIRESGLPDDVAQMVRGMDARQLDHILPALKMQQQNYAKLAEQVKQAQASNFNQFQRDHGVNRLASTNASPVGTGAVKSGSVQHLGAIMREMGNF